METEISRKLRPFQIPHEAGRDRVWAPLSIANKSRKYLILGPAKENRSKSVSSGEPLLLLGRTSGGWRLTQPRRVASRALLRFWPELRALAP